MFARGAGIMGVGWEALQHYTAATRAEVLHTANLLLAVALVLGVQLEDLRGALVRYVQENWDELQALDRERKGLNYYIARATRGASNGLLAEAACRLCGIQVFLRSLGNGRMMLFGTTGPMYELLFTNGQFVAVRQGPASKWSDSEVTDAELHRGEFGRARPEPPPAANASVTSAHVTLSSPNVSAMNITSSPSTSAAQPLQQPYQPEEGTRQPAGITTPLTSGSTATSPAPGPIRQGRQGHSISRNADNASPYNLRPRRQRIVQPTQERRRPTIVPFHSPELEDLEPQFAAELIQPVAPAYHVTEEGGITCGLPGCPAPEKVFAAISAWKRHVTLTRAHIRDAFCTQCRHQLVIPAGASEVDIALLMETHKRERCPLAQKRTMRVRAHEIDRLRAALRDVTHIYVPPSPEDDDMGDLEDEQAAQEQAGISRGPQARPQMMGATEAERRAYVCVDYAQHYKNTAPESYRQVIANLEADLS